MDTSKQRPREDKPVWIVECQVEYGGPWEVLPGWHKEHESYVQAVVCSEYAKEVDHLFRTRVVGRIAGQRQEGS